MKIKKVVLNISIFLLVLAIPACLALSGVQSHRYSKLAKEVTSLEKKQTELIEKNKRLISDIGVLSSSARIEKIAIEELGMEKASSENIVRIEVKKQK